MNTDRDPSVFVVLAAMLALWAGMTLVVAGARWVLDHHLTGPLTDLIGRAGLDR